MGYDVKIERNLLHALFDLKGSFKDLNSYMKKHIASLPEEPIRSSVFPIPGASDTRG